MCREIGGHGHSVIAREMGVLSYSTVSSVCAMLRRELKRDQKLKKRLEDIRRLLMDRYGQNATQPQIKFKGHANRFTQLISPCEFRGRRACARGKGVCDRVHGPIILSLGSLSNTNKLANILQIYRVRC